MSFTRTNVKNNIIIFTLNNHPICFNNILNVTEISHCRQIPYLYGARNTSFLYFCNLFAKIRKDKSIALTYTRMIKWSYIVYTDTILLLVNSSKSLLGHL